MEKIVKQWVKDHQKESEELISYLSDGRVINALSSIIAIGLFFHSWQREKKK